VKFLEVVPRDRRLEGVGEDADRDEGVAQVGRGEKGVAPGADRIGAVAVGRWVVAHSPRLLRRLRAHLAGLPAVLPGDLERDAHRLVDRMVRRLEAEHQQGLAGGAGVGERRLAGIEQTAVRRMQAGLRQFAHRPRARREVGEGDSARRLPARALLQPDPSFGDHPERALGADQHPVGARTGARPRQTPALPLPGRRDRAHRLDQVVDVRVEGRVVSARPGGDPAAQRRELERLREVAQGEPARPQLVLEVGAERPRLDARRARHVVDLEDTVESREVDRHRARVGVADPRLDASDDARPAAEGNRGRARAGAPLEQRLDVALVPGPRHQVGRVVDPPAEGTHEVAVGAAVGVRDTLVAIVADYVRQRRGRLEPRLGQVDRVEGHGLLDLVAAEAEPLADTRSGGLEVGARRLGALPAPPPVLAPPHPRLRRHATTSISQWKPSARNA
jgi:hypothetical protein